MCNSAFGTRAKRCIQERKKMSHFRLLSQGELRQGAVRNNRKYNPIPKRQFYFEQFGLGCLEAWGYKAKEITWQQNGRKVVFFNFFFLVSERS